MDTELAALKKYCLQLTLCPDISSMNHKHWKHYTGALPSETTNTNAQASSSRSGNGDSNASAPPPPSAP